MKQKSLDTIILEEAIRAKLIEQIDPRAKGAISQNNKNLAKQIYDSKGYLWDDPKGTVAAIKQIKTVDQFKAVNNELKKLTAGRDIATYLKSFLDKSDKKTWELILSYLKTQFANYPAETLYPIGKVYFNLMNDYTNPTSGKIATQYVSADYIKWWKQKQAEVISGISTSPGATITKTIQQYRHELAIIGGIVTAFIPILGPVLSTVIGMADAKMYYDDGDKYTAGLVTVLSLIPGGSAVAKGLARKIISKSGTLTAAEAAILGKVASSKTMINTKMAEMLKKAVESGKVKDSVLRNMTKVVKPVSKGVYKVIGTSVVFVTPSLAYDAAWNAANPNVTDAQMKQAEDEVLLEINSDIDRLFAQAGLKVKVSTPLSMQNIRTESNITHNDHQLTERMSTPDEIEPESDSDSSSSLANFFFIGTMAFILKGSAGVGLGVGISWLFRKIFKVSILRPKLFWRTMTDRRSINKILKEKNIKGLGFFEYRTLLRQVKSTVVDNTQELIDNVRSGTYTPEEAVEKFRNIYPGRITQNYNILVRNRMEALSQSAAVSTVSKETPALSTTIQQQPYTGTKMGFQQGKTVPRNWKYPNVTPTEFDELSYHERVILQQNPDLSLKDLRKRY